MRLFSRLRHLQILAIFIAILQVGGRGAAALDSTASNASSGFRDAKAARDAFLGQYGRAAKRLRDAVANVEARGHLRKGNDYEADFVYRLLDGKTQQILTYDPIERIRGYPNIHVRTFTPENMYCLSGKSAGDFTVSEVHTFPNDRSSTESIIRVKQWIGATYYLYDRPLIDVINEPHFTIRQVELVDVQGGQGVRFRFGLSYWFDYPKGESSVRLHFDEGEFTVLPRLDWALSSYRLVMNRASDKPGEPYEHLATIKPAEWGAEKLILPSSVETWNKYSEKPEPYLQCRFDSYEFGAVHDDVFLPSTFGIPDSILNRPVRRASTASLLSGAGVACLVASLIFAGLRRQQVSC